MNIGVLGTGMVGQAIGTKLVQLGHTVTMGSRVAAHEKAVAWAKENGSSASYGTFRQAAAFGRILFNCTHGVASLEVLRLAGEENLNGKVLIDISNPLDFSKGMPPTLSVSNTDSLGEQIQKTFPKVNVVKALNTVNAMVMVDPGRVNGGDHTLFMCGNDATAKSEAAAMLRSFGWKDENMIDLGDITNARATEMILPLWVRLYGVFQSPMFQFKIVR